MGLFGFLGSALSTVGSFANTLTGTLGSIGNVGSALGVNFLPRPAGNPLVIQASTAGVQGAGMAAAVRSGTPLGLRTLVGVAASIGKGITSMVAPILIKIATALGRRTMTLRQAVKIIRRTGRFLGPAATAAAVGITLNELGELILLDASRPRRRMNPANITALRRSMRRISSFHRLCQKADTLRAPRRRSPKRVPTTAGSIVQVR